VRRESTGLSVVPSRPTARCNCNMACERDDAMFILCDAITCRRPRRAISESI
jgi:hypothetical protein